MDSPSIAAAIVIVIAVAIASFTWYYDKPLKKQNNAWSQLELSKEELTPEALEREIKGKLVKPLQSLPVHVDLPRLAKKNRDYL